MSGFGSRFGSVPELVEGQNGDLHSEGIAGMPENERTGCCRPANQSAIISKMPGETILKVENLGVAFNGTEVIKDLSFEVNKGDVLAIIGPNGAGKTVLFRAILGLLPYKGTINWLSDARIGYVPQKLSVERDLPLTVREFLDYKDGKENILKILRSVGFSTQDEHHVVHHLLNRPLGVLSGGELQRVLIAFALLGQPEVLLFDEPTSGIDIGGEETIYNLLHRLNSEMGLTIFLISHDIHVVYKYANNVLCLNKEMVCFGSPHEALDNEALKKLYGGEVALYGHKEHHH